MGKFDNPAIQLHEFKGELFKSVKQCQRFLFGEMDVQLLDCLIVIHSYGTELPEQFRELGHILHWGTVCPDHPELLVKDPCGDELGFGQQAGLLKHGEKPCMAGFVQIDGFTADGRVRLGQPAPFSPCAGTLFLVVHIYVFYVVQFHRVALPPSVSPPQFATSEQIAAPCKGKRFLLQNGVVLQKTQLAMFGRT